MGRDKGIDCSWLSTVGRRDEPGWDRFKNSTVATGHDVLVSLQYLTARRAHLTHDGCREHVRRWKPVPLLAWSSGAGEDRGFSLLRTFSDRRAWTRPGACGDY